MNYILKIGTLSENVSADSADICRFLGSINIFGKFQQHLSTIDILEIGFLRNRRIHLKIWGKLAILLARFDFA